MQNHIVAAATKILLIATAVFGLAAGPSQAGEGARMPPQWNVVGDPFLYSAPQAGTRAAPPALDSRSEAFPAANGARMPVVVGQKLPPNSNEGVMQCCAAIKVRNLLPRMGLFLSSGI